MRMIGKVPWMRRRYARSTLKSIQRFRDRRRPLPENLARLDQQLRRLPQHKRQEALEEMLEMGGRSDLPRTRAMRRAAGRQERQSGKGKGLRPGLPPGAQRQVRR
jgi:hypothetical protein